MLRQKSFCIKVLMVVVAVGVAASDAAAQQYVYQPDADYYHNDTASGTIAGGGLGAITGAIIGGRDNRGEGALIGAGIGALTGRFFGKKKDAQDAARTNAGYAMAAEATAQAQALAVTNLDLIQMTQAGLSDDVIIGAVQNRGGRFDLSPQSLITLKQNGVSDRVVATVQQLVASTGTTPTKVITPAPAPVPVVAPAPPAVIVRPAPVVRFSLGPYRHRGYRRGPGRRW